MKFTSAGFVLGAFCAVLFALSSSVSAQTTTFTYQGRLLDGAFPASGTYHMRFTLHTAVSGGGNQVGTTITDTNVTVANGLFTVELDFGNQFPGADRWIEVNVKKPAEMTYATLAPRQKLLSVPYAVRAANVTATSGDSVITAINDGTTTFTINSNRLPADLVRINPLSTQDSTVLPVDLGSPVLDLKGRRDDGGMVFTDISRFRFRHDGGFFASGTSGIGGVPTTGAGSRFMWYPGKFALRAGKVDSFGSGYWDEANIGNGSIALGENVRASGNNSFAANLATTASGSESVALGNNGTASADRAFAFNGTASGVGAVAIGSGAQATSDDALALGPSSIAGGLASVTIGPSIANGSFAVAIGLQNKAAGNFSVAIGKNASTCSDYLCSPGTQKQGSIVISDGCAGFSSDAVTASANNQISMRGCGGIRMFTNQGLTSGVQLAAGGGAWSTISDVNMKENFLPVNARDILRGVLNIPVSTWNYKSQDRSIRHIGVMAQDFRSTFNVGESDRMITTIDTDGVALAAIQGLNEELKDRDKKIAEQETKLTALEKQLQLQQQAIDALKAIVCAENPNAAVCARKPE